MTYRCSDVRYLKHGAAVLPLLALGFSLGGCAGVGDSFASAAFVDPARYDQFDCKQLTAERNALRARTAELQGLIDKAGTATGGAVVGELVYRNDYISARAQAKLVEDSWRANRCAEPRPAGATPGASEPRAIAPGAAPSAGTQSKSGSAVY